MDKNEIRKKMQNFLEDVDKKEDNFSQIKKSRRRPEKKEKHAEYFEGQLQMRGINKEVLDYVQKRITNEGEQVPTVVTHSKNDLDYYVSSRRLIHKIGVELKAKYGGFVKESAQLFSRNHMTSKNVYRLNVFYKMHDITKGQIVSVEGEVEPFRVKGYLGERLIVENLKTSKKNHIEEKKIISKLDKFKSSVICIHPKTRVMDEDFQPVKLESDVELKEEQKVKIVCLKGKYYLC